MHRISDNKQRINSYHWKGFNPKGERCGGIIQAETLLEAKYDLIKQGIHLQKIGKDPFFLFQPSNKKIVYRDISLLSKQLATLIQSGIPLISAFETVKKGQAKYRMRSLISSLQRDISTGSTFVEALRQHPDHFSSLYCSLIAVGEQSGNLALILLSVVNHREKIEHIKRKVRKILTYPLIVFILAFFITMGLLFFVVPEFSAIFNAFNAELPFLTRLIIHTSNACRNHAVILCILSVILLCLLIYFYKNSSVFSHVLDRIIIRVPVLGTIITKWIFNQFSHTLSVTLSAGLPLLQAMHLASNVTGNRVYVLSIKRMMNELAEGTPLWHAIEKTGLFPDMMVQMIAVGERSGELHKILYSIADYYDKEIDYRIETLNSLLEPFIMIFLGLMIGLLLFAMYAPIFKLSAIT